MIDNKKIVQEIMKLENWASFEAFIYNLYKNSRNTISTELNYLRYGKSGRKREVDVFVKFGFDPHIILLGI